MVAQRDPRWVAGWAADGPGSFGAAGRRVAAAQHPGSRFNLPGSQECQQGRYPQTKQKQKS